MLIWEWFWSSFWLLKSIKTKLKIKRFLEAICDAILDDFEIKWDRIGVAPGRPGGRGGAAGGLNSLTESDNLEKVFRITPWLPASGGGGSEGFAPAAGPLLVGGWLGGGWDRFD